MIHIDVKEAEKQLLELELAMPEDECSVEGTEAELILAGMGLEETKVLAMYGLGKALAAAFPFLPHTNTPGSDECRQGIADLYVEKNMLTSEMGQVHSLSSHGHTLLMYFVGSGLDTGLANVNDNRMRAIKALQWEPIERGREETGRIDSLHISAKTSRDSVRYQLSSSMWGGSRELVDDLFKQLTGTPADDMDADQIGRISPQVRELLYDHKYRMHIKRLSGLSINHIMVLMEHDRFNEGLVIADDTLEVPEEPGQIGADDTHYFTEAPLDRVAAGCPARHVRGAVQWAPQMMLTAFEAIASHPPLPKLRNR